MQSADLLAIANVATAPPSTNDAPTRADDADAFARALADEMAATGKTRAAAPGDGRCGTSSETTPSSPERPVVAGERPDRPSRSNRAAWQGVLGGLVRTQGEQGPGRLALKGGFEGIAAGSGAGPKPSPATPSAFRDAIDALKAAIDAALQDPAAAGPQTPLPPPVQAALDQVLATAPEGLKARVEAFAGTLGEKLAALLAGKGDQAATPAADAAKSGADATASGEGLLSSVLAGLGLKDIQPVASPKLDAAATATGGAAPAAEAAGSPVAAAAAGTDAAKSPETVAVAASADRQDAGSTEPVLAATGDAATAAAEGVDGQAHASTSAASPPPAAAAVRGAPETVAMLASTIARKLEGRTTHFDMELHPAEFGRVDVRLRIDAEGRVAAQMSFDNPVAAADLRARADELRRQLEQAGFQVASEDLTFSDRGAGGSGQDARNAFAALAAESRESSRGRAFADAERNARLADDAGRLNSRALSGLDVRV